MTKIFISTYIADKSCSKYLTNFLNKHPYTDYFYEGIHTKKYLVPNKLDKHRYIQ